MVRKISPELALAKVMGELREKVSRDLYEEIVAAGSVPLGTYGDYPDLDIFILTRDTGKLHRRLKELYSWGRDKEGELTIYWVSSLMGYDTDFVIMHPDDERVQTLNHVKYYMERMDDDLRANIRWLKRFFKEINCYGAETGGITGICITRLAELFTDPKLALTWLIREILKRDGPFIEDPTLERRNLFASVKDFKRKIMITEMYRYLSGEIWKLRNLNYFFDNYDRVYSMDRKRYRGKDKEFQYIYSTIRKTWNELKNNVKWWHPVFDYDIFITPFEIHVGFKVTPRELEKSAYEVIPLYKLNRKAIDNLADRGAKYNPLLDSLEYERKPPFKSLLKEYEKLLLETLKEEYPRVERA